MKFIKYCFLLAIIAFAVTNSEAQRGKVKKIAVLLNEAHRGGVFNGSVLIAENGKTIYQSAFGYSDASKKTNLTADYRFNIGSIAKEFNAVGIMILKERGKLDINDKISKYLPDLPAWAEKISIVNLLQYTSGLPDINWKTVKSDADVLRDLKTAQNLNFAPGTKYAYNNSNVFLQRQIIEKISGASFAEFVEKEMLRPCEMNASIVDPPLRGLAKIAVSFNNDFVEDARQFTYPMSGWTSVTAADLYKWTRCLHSYKLINQSSFNEILKPFAPNNQSGLGKGDIENGVFKEHSHHGTSFDFEALMYSEPSNDVTIILLTNNKNSKVFEIKDAIESILRGTPYKIPKKSIQDVLSKQIDNLSAEEIIKMYNDLKNKQPKDYDFDAESVFNQIGYSLMNRKRIDEAIKIFKVNVEKFPKSANVYDSLGEAYFNKGDKESALQNYRKSFELNSKNLAAKEMIDKLEKEK